MSNLLILSPQPIASIVAARGSGAVNLLTPEPKEAWFDAATGAVSIDIDLGAVVAVDTIYLGAIGHAAATATWSISGGVAGPAETVLQAATALRAPAIGGALPEPACGLWMGAAANVRWIRLTLNQPALSLPLTAGIVMVGQAFRPTWNHEWGSGRRPIDTGVATALPSGGFSIVPGARKTAWSWTLGDLTDAEVEMLYALALDRGETAPVLVAENPDNTAGLHGRLHYGLFRALKPYERRNVAQTRWDFTIEEWV